jgi:hypothetical protein
MIRIQYWGCQSDRGVRQYTFRVLEQLKDDREFVYNFKTETLMTQQFKFQDVPDLCFTKLKNDLELEIAEAPLCSQRSVSDGELQKYLADHYPAKRKIAKQV